MATLGHKVKNAHLTVTLYDRDKIYYVSVAFTTDLNSGIAYHMCWYNNETAAREDYREQCEKWGVAE